MARVKKQHVQMISGISYKFLSKNYIQKEKKSLFRFPEQVSSSEINEPFRKIEVEINDLCENVLR